MAVTPRSFQRFHPLCKDGSDGAILLQMDAENFAGAVIHIEVAGNFGLLGFKDERAG